MLIEKKLDKHKKTKNKIKRDKKEKKEKKQKKTKKKKNKKQDFSLHVYLLMVKVGQRRIILSAKERETHKTQNIYSAKV